MRLALLLAGAEELAARRWTSRAVDPENKAFRLSEIRGSPVLLKFFLGHW
jgi:hypothetical protein